MSKLYPFSTMKNQHNFDLIHSLCYVAMRDMEDGTVAFNEAEYDRLAALDERALHFFCLPLPVAWLTGKEYGEAKELVELAVNHRINACIENGRVDLVQYC